MPTIDNNISNAYSIYGRDPREIPLYGMSQAARYLKIPLKTLASWVRGRKYPVGKDGEHATFEPVIKRPDPNSPLLSFMNLIEGHVLCGMRRIESVPFYVVRKALRTLESEYPSAHPLADHEFYVHGVDLFIKRLDEYIPVSGRQWAIKEVLETYLRRIDRGLDKTAIRLYPFIKREYSQDEPKFVFIDPLVSFGRPVIVGTGVPTDIIAERFYAGDTWNVLAKDYDITPQQVQQALRYEAPVRRAA